MSAGEDPRHARLVAEARRRLEGAPPSHDFSHVLRVVESAQRIALAEGANLEVCRTAALLHELVNLPKNHPGSALSGDLCAEEARALLEREGHEPSFCDEVALAIRDHAFSKGVVPSGLSSRVLQDADRLDAIGAIGVARCMATASEMGSLFYAPTDPTCRERAPDDKAFALDHFYKKLFLVPERLHTSTARRMAAERMAFMKAFVEQLGREVGFDAPEGGLAGGSL